MSRPFCLLAAFCCLLLAGCRKEVSDEGTRETAALLRIHITHQFNGQPLELNKDYENSFGESFTLNRFKYYISNIKLLNGNQSVEIPEAYFLVDETVDSTKALVSSIPEGTYDGVSFLLGVDSIRNISGAQTEALDPIHDMFWTWSTGYIMAKLEGTSPQSAAPNNRIQYHIGGFEGVYSALRRVNFRFFSPLPVNDSETLNVTITTELQKWFNGQHELRIAGEPVSMTPGLLSSQYADNHASMFQITSAVVQ